MFHSCIQIPVEPKIGEGLKIGHFGNIVINHQAVIGRNFRILAIRPTDRYNVYTI